jgi:GntR family histidine utilization transcriptional repressor
MKTTSPATISLHQQILGDIERRIVSGEWSPGYQLPIEIEMAKSYQVSRMTMNKVLTRLANNGLIERRKGSGSFVAQPRVQSAVLEIHDIEAEVRSLNREYRFRLVSRTTRKANAADAAAFLPERKSQVLDISCVHFAGRRPFCTEDRLINLNVVPEAGDIDFARHAPGQWLQRQVPGPPPNTRSMPWEPMRSTPPCSR